jgi:hypothetical protein
MGALGKDHIFDFDAPTAFGYNLGVEIMKGIYIVV